MQRIRPVLLVCCLAFAGCPAEENPSKGVETIERDVVPVPPQSAGDVAQPETLSSGEGGDSPADCFYRMKRAYDGEQFGEYYDVLSPDSREKMLPMLSIFCGLVTSGSKESLEEYKQLLSKHGLEDLGEKEPAGPGQEDPSDEGAGGGAGMDINKMTKEFDGVEDKRALFADLFAFLSKNKARMGDTEKVVGVEGLKVDGDKASARLIIRDDKGNEKRDPAEFRKIDGRWYAHVSMGQ